MTADAVRTLIANGRSGRPRRTALTMLRELPFPSTPADEQLLDYVYTQVLVAEGLVHKTTRRGRFSDLDDRLVEDVRARFAVGERPVDVHDLGASSGITSVELFHRFEEAGAPVRLVASDLYDALYLVEIAGSTFSVVFNSEFEPMQYIGGGFVLTAHRGKYQEGPWYPVNRALKQWLDRSLLQRARRLLATTPLPSLDGERTTSGGRVVRIPLVHPECLQLLRGNPAFTFVRHDVFEPSRTRYQVVRAMNILNRGYFADAQLRRGIGAILSSLVDGGLFVAGRSVPGAGGEATHATAFVRRRGGFVPAWTIGDGSEIASLVVDAREEMTPREERAS